MTAASAASFQDEAAKTEQKNGIKATIANVYNSLAHVTVVTVVGGATVALSSTRAEPIKATVSPAGDGGKAFVTQINLVDGDITAALPAEVEEMPSVLALHEGNVELASQVLPANIEALVNAGRAIIDLFDDAR